MCSHGVPPSSYVRSASAVSSGLFQVLEHELRRAQNQLADFTGGHRLGGILGIDNARVNVGHWQADRTNLALALYRIQAAGHHRFRERIAFEHHCPGLLLELTACLSQQCRCATDAEPDRSQIHFSRPNVGMIQHRVVQRGHAVEERGFHLLDRFQHIADIARIGHERQRVRSDERQRLHADVGVDVEERKRQHDDIGPRLLR